VVAATAVFSAATMLLWNWLMPAIFGLVTINFWQALGLLVLSRIILGMPGHAMMFAWGRHHQMGPGRAPWAQRPREIARERWHQMTKEEKEEAREKYRKMYFAMREQYKKEAEQQAEAK
jgi:hypothetical protein